MYKKTLLDNGIRIVTSKMPSRESVSIGVWISVGGRYEDMKLKGIAHYLEHIAFKGSKKYSCQQIKESIEGVGGALNGFTAEEFTCYLAKVPSKYLNLALRVLLDMTFNPLILAKDVDKEKTVILEELKMYMDLPQHYVGDLLDSLLWPNHPLGMNIAGTLETVSHVNSDNLLNFKQRFYEPRRAVIAVCGNLEHADTVEEIKKIISLNYKFRKINFLKANSRQLKPRFNFYDKETQQNHLAIGFHALKRDHPDRFALGLLHVVLGANMSSRLFQQVREVRGLAYEISSNLKRFADTGAFIIQAGVDNKNSFQAIKVILEELRKIQLQKVKQDEFLRAKEYFLGQLSLALEDTLEHMFWIGESTSALDKIFTKQEIFEKVQQIKREDLLRVARGIFKKNNFNLALIGKLGQKEKEKIKGLF
ncbi:MAG: pitrilysin family protein [Candidatus Omnitrophota bacterium]|nr:pitrilysin family protein [Candidatus Omnitrophota bacterium]